MANITEKLFDFLWAHPHKERSGIAAGSGTNYIFEVEEGELKEFESLYIKAARGGVDDLEDDPLPLECVTWRPNRCGDGPEWTEGEYERQYPGYDFDGFYESGPRVKVECVKHLTFYIRVWYHDNFLRRTCCMDPQPYLNRSYTVCIMKENSKDEQDNEKRQAVA